MTIQEAPPQPRLMRLADVQFTGQEFWRPINDQQLSAIHCKAKLLLYGGGSGGGKTDLLVADAVQEHENPNLRALLIRRSFTEMENIIDRCRAIYTQLGATPQDGGKKWRFPSGAKVRLGYMKDNGDIGQYQGVPFSYLGVDESTYLRENSVRDILPWMVSPDPTLFCRARLATNPGQIGADWHMHVFLRGKCPIHFPHESVIPGAVYQGATWQSDQKPTQITTCFIPALAVDNPLYGQEKIDLLESQRAENSEKLLKGCWCALEGMYFKFLQPRYKMPYAEAGEEWWHHHIIGVDYGYMGSWAAAGLYFVSEPSVEWPQGRMFQVGELTENNMGSEDFAVHIGENFVVPQLAGHRREFEYAVFDPANDAQTGNGRSNFDIMRTVLEERYSISSIKASKGAGSRISNAQNLYRMLKTGSLDKPKEWKPGQLVITDVAPITFSSLSSRMHDSKHPGDVLKVKDDKKDDLYDQLCLVEGTQVLTARGDIPIEEVAFGDRVMTRQGWKRVLWSGSTGKSASLLTLKMSDGRSLTGTPNHPVFVVDRGFICLDELSYGDNVVLWRWEESKPSFSTGSSSGVTPIPKPHAQEITSPQARTTSGAALTCFIERCGSFIRDQFRKVITSTTSTRTHHTTRSAILNASLPMNMPPAIPITLGPTEKGTSSIFAKLGRWRLRGTQLQKVSTGIASRPKSYGLNRTRIKSSSAPAAIRPSDSADWHQQNIAPVPAPRKRDAKAGLIKKTSLVRYAGPSSEPVVSSADCIALANVPKPPTGERVESWRPELVKSAAPRVESGLPHENPPTESTVPISVLAKESAGSGKVYNLHVEDCHEFFANGILVHNCYAANTYFSGSEKPKEAAMLEKLKKYKDAGMDESSLSIYQAQMQRDLSREDAPISMGRGRGKTIIRRR